MIFNIKNALQRSKRVGHYIHNKIKKYEIIISIISALMIRILINYFSAIFSSIRTNYSKNNPIWGSEHLNNSVTL